jgi:hypothetical protein
MIRDLSPATKLACQMLSAKIIPFLDEDVFVVLNVLVELTAQTVHLSRLNNYAALIDALLDERLAVFADADAPPREPSANNNLEA